MTVDLRVGLPGLLAGLSLLGMRAYGAAEEAEVSRWQQLISVRAMGGYKDNVVLSADLPDQSAFLGASLEMIGWRPLGDKSEFFGFLVGEHRQYLDAEEVDFEQTLMGQVQIEHRLSDAWTLTGPVEYLYLDQVLDVSATETLVEPARIRGQTLGLRPSVKHHFSAGTLELLAGGGRQIYETPLDDTWEAGGELQWQHPLGPSTRSDLFYELRQTWYDNDAQRRADGTEVEGTRRKMQRHELGLKWRHEWGEDRSWRWMGRLSGMMADDQYAGYYNYVRSLAELRLRYRSGGWSMEGTVRGRAYFYRQQTVSESDVSRRRRAELDLEVKGEREIASWLLVFVEYTHEQTFANRPTEVYSVNTVSCGLEASF